MAKIPRQRLKVTEEYYRGLSHKGRARPHGGVRPPVPRPRANITSPKMTGDILAALDYHAAALIIGHLRNVHLPTPWRPVGT